MVPWFGNSSGWCVVLQDVNNAGLIASLSTVAAPAAFFYLLGTTQLRCWTSLPSYSSSGAIKFHTTSFPARSSDILARLQVGHRSTGKVGETCALDRGYQSILELRHRHSHPFDLDRDRSARARS